MSQLSLISRLSRDDGNHGLVYLSSSTLPCFVSPATAATLDELADTFIPDVLNGNSGERNPVEVNSNEKFIGKRVTVANDLVA